MVYFNECPACDGTGFKYTESSCSYCYGTGDRDSARCPSCLGLGHLNPSDPYTGRLCITCGGMGTTRGRFPFFSQCSHCLGTGTVEKLTRCILCNGKGRI